ncbi:MAG: hypothetical protein H0U25_01930 [Thermoleophilaceae bacterium]|nr:hypothetical protein [Thermoleophilaceae bacterium]
MIRPTGARKSSGYLSGGDHVAIAQTATATMEALGAGVEGRSVEPGPLVAAAAEQVGRRWPV